MLLLCSGASVLVEQRPPVGIWGGLWSLPEMTVSDPQLLPGEFSGLRPTRFARFEHVFTHFRMKADVWRAEVGGEQAARVLRQAAPSRWLALADAAAAPLPRPIKSLLNSLAESTLTGLR